MSDKPKNGHRQHARPPHQEGSARRGQQRRDQMRGDSVTVKMRDRCPRWLVKPIILRASNYDGSVTVVSLTLDAATRLQHSLTLLIEQVVDEGGRV